MPRNRLFQVSFGWYKLPDVHAHDERRLRTESLIFDRALPIVCRICLPNAYTHRLLFWLFPLAVCLRSYAIRSFPANHSMVFWNNFSFVFWLTFVFWTLFVCFEHTDRLDGGKSLSEWELDGSWEEKSMHKEKKRNWTLCTRKNKRHCIVNTTTMCINCNSRMPRWARR